MKQFLFLATAFLFSLGAMAQNKVDDVAKFSSEKYAFGKIKQGAPVTTFFEITNKSNKPLVIENAFASCGCTTPEYSKAPIAPGATAKLKVGYNAAAMGAFDKPVTIKFAGIEEPKVVHIVGEVLDEKAYTEYQKNNPEKKTTAKAKA